MYGNLALFKYLIRFRRNAMAITPILL